MGIARGVAILAGGAALAVGAAAASGETRPKPPSRLPPGSTIADVAVGELGPARTRAALERELGARYERRIFVRGRHRRVVPGRRGTSSTTTGW
jgi:hypothetical protein